MKPSQSITLQSLQDRKLTYSHGTSGSLRQQHEDEGVATAAAHPMMAHVALPVRPVTRPPTAALSPTCWRPPAAAMGLTWHSHFYLQHLSLWTIAAATTVATTAPTAVAAVLCFEFREAGPRRKGMPTYCCAWHWLPHLN